MFPLNPLQNTSSFREVLIGHFQSMCLVLDVTNCNISLFGRKQNSDDSVDDYYEDVDAPKGKNNL